MNTSSQGPPQRPPLSIEYYHRRRKETAEESRRFASVEPFLVKTKNPLHTNAPIYFDYPHGLTSE
jgi:hypothetical protein